MQRFIFALVFSVLLAFPACAAATPSDADELDPDDLEELQYADMELINDLEETDPSDQDLKSILALLEKIAGGDELATQSNAVMEEADPDSPVLGEITVFDSPVFLSLEGEESFVNALRFDVNVNGSDYTLLFSPSLLDQLFVDSQGRLWNMGTAQVQGRVFDGSFDPYASSGTLVYLAPCLGNNFSAIYNYGSPNWFREYYWSSGRLTYDDTYVQIQVTETHYPARTSDLPMYLLIFLVGGGVLLCWLNRFRHY